MEVGGRAHVYRGEGGSEAKRPAAVPGEAFDHPLDHLTSLPVFTDRETEAETWDNLGLLPSALTFL